VKPAAATGFGARCGPATQPLQRLTELLASLSNDDDPIVASGRRERIAAQLQRSSFGISEALGDTTGLTGKSLVLVVDQFEELFRYAAAGSARANPTAADVRARDEATQFVQLLLEASRAPLLTINVMLTMRSDFIGDCARFSRPSRGGMRGAVSRPFADARPARRSHPVAR